MDHKVGIIRRIYWDLGIGMKVMIVFDPRMTIGVINEVGVILVKMYTSMNQNFEFRTSCKGHQVKSLLKR
jgi:hypothetical protein